MGELAAFTISSEQTAGAALDYFNGFHDGFMQRIAIASRDRIERDLGQTCSGVFDVQIDFAHYNYADGAAPFHGHDNIVHAEFRDVQDILFEFSAGYMGNSIIGLFIRRAERRGEPCLALHLARHYYREEERRYELREGRLFTFAEARFAEGR